VASSNLGLISGSTIADVMALYAFVALGLPDGLIGTAWPAVRQSFGAPLADLGLVLSVGTVGSVASSSVAGLLLSRLGLARAVVLAGSIGASGVLLIALSPNLWVFVAGGWAFGVASGLLDSSLNVAIALAGRNRLLNVLHGCYGIGTTIGPLVVTLALLAGSWRPSYLVALLAEVLLVAGWLLAGRHLARRSPVRPPALGTRPAPALVAALTKPFGAEPTLLVTSSAKEALWKQQPSAKDGRSTGKHRPVRSSAAGTVVLGLVVFAVYTGCEVSAAQWEPSFDRSVLHLGASATGLATFGYWGALTLARFALALPKRSLRPAFIVRWGCAIAVGGAGAVWWRPAPVVALVGLIVIAASLAGVFPALVTLTPLRVGEQLAHHVIGWQIGAASIGGSLISAALGEIFQRWGLVNFGPSLVVVAFALVLGTAALQRRRPA
jgi:fucose permease